MVVFPLWVREKRAYERERRKRLKKREDKSFKKKIGEAENE